MFLRDDEGGLRLAGAQLIHMNAKRFEAILMMVVAVRGDARSSPRRPPDSFPRLQRTAQTIVFCTLAKPPQHAGDDRIFISSNLNLEAQWPLIMQPPRTTQRHYYHVKITQCNAVDELEDVRHLVGRRAHQRRSRQFPGLGTTFLGNPRTISSRLSGLHSHLGSIQQGFNFQGRVSWSSCDQGCDSILNSSQIRTELVFDPSSCTPTATPPHFPIS